MSIFMRLICTVCVQRGGLYKPQVWGRGSGKNKRGRVRGLHFISIITQKHIFSSLKGINADNFKKR